MENLFKLAQNRSKNGSKLANSTKFRPNLSESISRVKSKNMTGNCRGLSNKKIDDLKKTFNSNLRKYISNRKAEINQTSHFYFRSSLVEV